MFKINTPVKISIFLSLIITSFALALFIFLEDLLFLPYLIFFTLNVYLIYYVVKNFFHEKIKVIYKNIYKFRGISANTDLDIDNVEKEAEEWADAKEEELKQMKQDENYRREFLGNVSHVKTPILIFKVIYLLY